MFLWIIAALWFYHQNNYFGWNESPSSDMELLTDGITFLLVAIALVGNAK